MTFPVGAKVYVDGRDLATISQAFPKGSSSFAFPHYKVNIVGGDRNVAVAMNRVGVVKKNPLGMGAPEKVFIAIGLVSGLAVLIHLLMPPAVPVNTP